MCSLSPLWFLLSEQHVGRLRSDPAGVRQTELQPGPPAGPLGRPGEDEAVAADGGGRPLDDGVHALLLRPAEVETGSTPTPEKLPYRRADIRQRNREPRCLVTVRQTRTALAVPSPYWTAEQHKDRKWAELLREKQEEKENTVIKHDPP